MKLEYTEKFCWYLSVTKNRSKVIKKYLDNKKIIVKDDDGKTICKFDKESITFKNKDNTNFFIESKFIDSLSNETFSKFTFVFKSVFSSPTLESYYGI